VDETEPEERLRGRVRERERERERVGGLAGARAFYRWGRNDVVEGMRGWGWTLEVVWDWGQWGDTCRVQVHGN
jgi:hypothetical protein